MRTLQLLEVHSMPIYETGLLGLANVPRRGSLPHCMDALHPDHADSGTIHTTKV